jgi:serine/threonine protein kinase
MDDLCAAEYLEGIQLPNGWNVLERVSPSTTGGNFGVCYIVEKKEKEKVHRAFLKALNLRRLAQASDFARALEQHLAAFNFERDTLEVCRSRHMRRVAKLLDAGQHVLPNHSLPVCYIVFELADVGDVRRHLAKVSAFDLAWTLRTLHQIAVGLSQLHTHGIAHQDVKPSNILIFKAFGAKISDLGCADVRSNPSPSPMGAFRVAGDPSYAPPELFYNEVSLDWNVRRLGCDLYLLGSLIVFFFTGGASMTALLRKKIAPPHAHNTWPHDYRTVLPYVRNAFEEALVDLEPLLPSAPRTELVELIRRLCDPDPKRRGYVELSTQYDLQRVISKFNLLATKAEYNC